MFDYTSFAVNAIEQTGLDVPPARLARLVREAKGMAKELGRRAGMEHIRTVVKAWERGAVAVLFASGAIR